MTKGALSALTLVVAASLAHAEIVDRVAAVVNGDIILLSELEERAGPRLPQPDAKGAALEQRRQLLHRAADELIAERLVQDVAREQGLEPSPSEIDAAIENVKRENRIDDATLEAALAQQGLTMESYREMLSKQLTQMKVAEVKVRPRVNVSEDDVRRRYEEMVKDVDTVQERRVRDVFLPAGADRDAARARVEEARKRALAGESFEQIARETGGPLAEDGGDLGWVKPGTMVPALEKVAFGLKKGEVSEVVEAGGGFHLLYVEDTRTSGGARPLAQAREEIRNQLFAERMAKATEEYLSELRRTADVDLRIP